MFGPQLWGDIHAVVQTGLSAGRKAHRTRSLICTEAGYSSPSQPLARIVARNSAMQATIAILSQEFTDGRTNGDGFDSSDVDLIISGGSAFDKTDIFAIAEDFHIASGKNVDVYDESEIDPATPFGKATLH